MRSLVQVVQQMFPQIKSMPREERELVAQHMRPYLEDNALDNLVMLPLQQQKQVIAKLILDQAIAKAKCDQQKRALQEDFTTHTAPDVEADVRAVFAEDVATMTPEQREFTIAYITDYIFPYKFSGLFPDPRIQKISRYSVLNSAGMAYAKKKEPAAIPTITLAPPPATAAPAAPGNNLGVVPQEAPKQPLPYCTDPEDILSGKGTCIPPPASSDIHPAAITPATAQGAATARSPEELIKKLLQPQFGITANPKSGADEQTAVFKIEMKEEQKPEDHTTIYMPWDSDFRFNVMTGLVYAIVGLIALVVLYVVLKWLFGKLFGSAVAAVAPMPMAAPIPQ